MMMMTSYLYLLLITTLTVAAQELSSATTNNPTATESITSVQTNGFNDDNINTSTKEESWLKQHDRYVFIIVIVLVVLAVLIWYIVRSIRNMRRKLAAENQGHNNMMMVQETIDTNGFHKMPDYPHQPQQQQQPYEHRY